MNTIINASADSFTHLIIFGNPGCRLAWGIKERKQTQKQCASPLAENASSLHLPVLLQVGIVLTLRGQGQEDGR